MEGGWTGEIRGGKGEEGAEGTRGRVEGVGRFGDECRGGDGSGEEVGGWWGGEVGKGGFRVGREGSGMEAGLKRGVDKSVGRWGSGGEWGWRGGEGGGGRVEA